VLPGVGIIALTSLNDSAYRQAALAAGADDLVRKTELTKELLPAIWRVTRVNRFR
jgi:DNA-binding response OmpR family regulator